MKTKAEFKNRSWMQFTQLFAGLVLALTLPQSYAAPGDVDFSFDPGSTINGQVNAVAFQSDGKAVIAGNFNTLQNVMRGGVARLNADGTTDETFLHGLQGINDFGYVECLAIQSDDKVLIGGWFYSVNGVARTNLARLNADGSLDASFLVAFSGDYIAVHNLAVQNDGKIIVIGAFDSLNGVPQTNIARLNVDGSVDGSFAAQLVANGESAEPYCLAVQDDAKIVIGGWFTSVNGLARTNLARLNADGTLDTTFAADLAIEDGPAFPSYLALQSDGKILVGGAFSSVNGVWRTNIARLNVDGSLDDSFVCTNTEPSGDVSRIIPCHDGKIVACGTFSPDGVEPMNVARLNADGSLDASFRNAVPDGGAISAVIQNDDRIVVVGEFWKVDGRDRRCVARLNSDGSLDNSFDNGGGPTGPNSALGSVLVQGDGKVLIGGPFYSVNGQLREGIARLNPDGSLEDSFTAGIGGSYPYLRCMTLQTDGKILLGGDFSTVNGEARNGIARLNTNGTLDTTFVNVNGLGGTDSGVLCIAVQTNGQILIGGLFQTVNGEPRYSLARLNTDGTLDPGFTNNPIYARPVRAVLVQRDGKIVAGGGLPMLLTRFNADGTRDNSFWSNATEVNCLAEQPDGKILAGGHFTRGNVQWNGIARILSDGTVDDTFLNSIIGPEGPVYRLALEADGKIIVAGDFNWVDGVSRKHIARLNSDGSLDASFVVDLHQWDSAVAAIAVQPDTKILLGGYFTAVNQTPRSYVARLMGACVPPLIRSAPQNCTAEIGSAASLGVVADGFPAVGYQWFFNGTNALASCTNRILLVSGVQSSHAGSYTVVISNAGGSVTSAPVVLNVIAAVERRPVPAVHLNGEPGSTMNLECADNLTPAPGWLPLATVSLNSTAQYYFDISLPLPPQRFYRAWQTGTPSVVPSLNLNFVPAITLTGNVGDSLHLDCINAIGPTNDWVTLATVTLTNTSQLYFDVSSIGQPRRLYRIVPAP